MYIESRGLKIMLSPEVYKPREDSFLVIDALKEQEDIHGPLLEVGSGSGIIILSAISDRQEFHLAVEINFQASLQTINNAKINGDDNLQVVCGDLVQPFRKGALPKTIIFNPPYLPEDPDVDPFSPDHELQQLVGGKQGHETASRLLTSLNPGDYEVYLIISSLATNPNIHEAWRSLVIRSENMGFETIWLMRFE
jgi:methylase of polypeptide subunit release factors